MCLGKLRFADECACRVVAQESINRPQSMVKMLWVYQCPNCRGYHMTKLRNYRVAPVSPTDLYVMDELAAQLALDDITS